MKPRRRICASIALTILCTVRMQGGAEAADLAHLNCVAGPIKEPLVSPCGTYTGAMTITAWSLLQLKVIRRCRTTSSLLGGPRDLSCTVRVLERRNSPTPHLKT